LPDRDELDELEGAVRETLRTKVEHVRKVVRATREPVAEMAPEVVSPQWSEEYQRLDAAYRAAREALDEWIADRRAHPYA